MNQPYLKQLTGMTHIGKLPETIFLNALRLPQWVWYVLGGCGLVVLILSLIIVPEGTVYGLTAVGAGIPLFLLLWHRPELGLVGIVFLSAGLLPPELAEIRLPIGGLELRDVALISLLGLVVFQGLLRKSLPIYWAPVGVPLLIFLLIAVFSLFNALVFEKVATNWAFNDMRILIYYSMFFLAVWSIRKRNYLSIVLLGLFIIADLIAAAIILQQFFGENSYVLPAMSRWNIQDIGVIVRVVPTAHALLHFMTVIAFALILFTRQNLKLKVLYVLQFLFFVVASLLTFTRSQWLATTIAISLMLVFLIPLYKERMIKYSLRFGIPLLLILVFAIGFGGASLQRTLNEIPVVSGIIERASTIFTPEETLDTGSLEWRQFELEESLRSISENPWLGVSLGNAYRDTTLLQGEVLGWWTDGNLAAGEISRFTRYVHSSYVAIPVKMGIPSIIVFMWFCIAFIFYGGRLYRRLPVGLEKGLVLAIVTGFVGLMEWAIFMTHFFRTESTVVVGTMVGIVGTIHVLTRPDDAVVASKGLATSPNSARQRPQFAMATALFNRGNGLYGLLLIGLGLSICLYVVNPLVSNTKTNAPFASNSTTNIELPAVSGNSPSQMLANNFQKLNIIQPQNLQTFKPDESIFISWIWPTKLLPEQEFTIALFNAQQWVVLGTQSQEGSNNRYWLNATIPTNLSAGEYQLLIQLQSTSEESAIASSQPRSLYILARPELPMPTMTATPTSTVTPMPTKTILPMVQVLVSSVSLREGPSRNYGIIGYLYAEDVVQVIAKDSLEGEWYNVILEDGTTGWIASNVSIPLDEVALTAVPLAATIPPLPTPTATPIFTPTAISAPPQENRPQPVAPPPTLTPPPLP